MSRRFAMSDTAILLQGHLVPLHCLPNHVELKIAMCVDGQSTQINPVAFGERMGLPPEVARHTADLGEGSFPTVRILKELYKGNQTILHMYKVLHDMGSRATRVLEEHWPEIWSAYSRVQGLPRAGDANSEASSCACGQCNNLNIAPSHDGNLSSSRTMMSHSIFLDRDHTSLKTPSLYNYQNTENKSVLPPNFEDHSEGEKFVEPECVDSDESMSDIMEKLGKCNENEESPCVNSDLSGGERCRPDPIPQSGCGSLPPSASSLYPAGSPPSAMTVVQSGIGLPALMPTNNWSASYHLSPLPQLHGNSPVQNSYSFPSQSSPGSQTVFRSPSSLANSNCSLMHRDFHADCTEGHQGRIQNDGHMLSASDVRPQLWYQPWSSSPPEAPSGASHQMCPPMPQLRQGAVPFANLPSHFCPEMEPPLPQSHQSLPSRLRVQEPVLQPCSLVPNVPGGSAPARVQESLQSASKPRKTQKKDKKKVEPFVLIVCGEKVWTSRHDEVVAELMSFLENNGIPYIALIPGRNWTCHPQSIMDAEEVRGHEDQFLHEKFTEAAVIVPVITPKCRRYFEPKNKKREMSHHHHRAIFVYKRMLTEYIEGDARNKRFFPVIMKQLGATKEDNFSWLTATIVYDFSLRNAMKDFISHVMDRFKRK